MGVNALSNLSSFLTEILVCISSVFFVPDCLFTLAVTVCVAFVLFLSAGDESPSSVCLHRPLIFSTSPAFNTVSKTSLETVVSPEIT